MARTNKASQTLASKNKLQDKILHQLAHKRIDQVARKEKPLLPVRLKVSISQQTLQSRMVLDKNAFLHFTKKMGHSFEKNVHIQTPALLALKAAGQAYLLELLEDWTMCASHAKRVTVTSSDIHLTRCLQGGVIQRSRAIPAWQHLALKQMKPV